MLRNKQKYKFELSKHKDFVVYRKHETVNFPLKSTDYKLYFTSLSDGVPRCPTTNKVTC